MPPPSTAATIDEKLSSVRVMSAASFVTSVPVITIATPMSDCFRAGALIDTIPGHRDDIPLALEHVDESHLVLRRDARDHPDLVDLLVELGVRERSELGAGQCATFDSQLGRDRVPRSLRGRR